MNKNGIKKFSEKEGTMNKQTKHIYWMVVLAGCGLVGTCLGLCVNVAGLFFTPIASEFGIGRGSVSASLTVYNLVHAFTGLLAAKTVLRFGFRRTVLFGTFLQTAATFLLALCHSVLPMLLLNGVRGFGSGLIGTVMVTIMLNYWFNKDNALMTSIALGFAGLSGAVFSPVLSSLITASGWRTAYMVMAGVILLFNLPALLFPIALKPEIVGREPYGGVRQADSDRQTVTDPQKISVSMFMVLAVFAACAAGNAALPPHFSGLAESCGLASIGALMVSVCMISNTAGKVILGAMIDRFGARISVSIYTVIIAASAVFLAFSRTAVILVGAACLYGLCYSLGTVATPILAREMFPTSQYSNAYPKLAMTTTVSNAVFTTVAGAMYDMSGSYTPICLMMCCMILTSLVMVQTAYRLKERQAG